jgi:hypothetical protein
MADDLGLDELRSKARTFIGGARVSGGDRGGLADLEQAVVLAIEANSPHSALAYGNLASSLIVLGDLARGFELQLKGRQAAERFGLASEARYLQAEHVIEDYWRGRWKAAVQVADEFIAASEAGVRHFMEDTCRLVRGRIRLARGDLVGALQDAAAGMDFAEQSKEPQALLPARAFHVHALLAADRHEEAGAVAGELLALAGQGSVITNPDWSGELALVLHALGRGAQLVKVIARCRQG